MRELDQGIMDVAAKSSVNRQLCWALMLLPLTWRVAVSLSSVLYATVIALGHVGAGDYPIADDKGLDRYVRLW